MKQIKLVGRELSVLRAVDHNGSTGQYLHERTSIEPADLLDILNSLSDSGYLEAYLGDNQLPTMEPVSMAQMHLARFEINPSYHQELKKLLLMR